MRVIVNYKNNDKRVINADDVDVYKDHVEVYPICCEAEPLDVIKIYKKDINAVYQCYDWFGEQRKNKIL